MTLQEAIKILSETAFRGSTTFNERFYKAVKLAIEACKRIESERTGYEKYSPDLLPGETED